MEGQGLGLGKKWSRKILTKNTYMLDKLSESRDVVHDAIVGPAGKEHVTNVARGAVTTGQHELSIDNIQILCCLRVCLVEEIPINASDPGPH